MSATRRVAGRRAKLVFLTQKSLYFIVFRPKTTGWPSLGRISVEILMATPRSRQIFRWRRRRRLHFVLFFMLFCSIELLLVHNTCLHIFFVYIYLHLLAQDARLCHGRGKDHRILWTIVNASGRLGFHGFGDLRTCMPKGSFEVAPPPNASPEAGYGSEEGYVGSEISGAVSGVTTPGASRL